MWQGTAPRHPDGSVIVEAQRRRGDAVTFHKYSRNLLDAATGTFNPAAYVSLEDREGADLAAASLKMVAGDDVDAWAKLARYYATTRQRSLQVEAERRLGELRSR